MADSKISALSALASIGDADEFVLASSGTTKRAVGTKVYRPGATDVAVVDGGTGASTALAALTNLTVTNAKVPAGSAGVINRYYLCSSYAAISNGPTTTTDQRMEIGSPMVLPHAITISKLSIFVQTTAGGTGSVIRMGIYQITTADPFAPTIGAAYGSLLLDAGTVASNSTGVKEITSLTQVIPAWTPFVCVFVPQGAPSPNPSVNRETFSANSVSGSHLGQASVANTCDYTLSVTGVSAGLPATLTPGAIIAGQNGGAVYFFRSA